MQDASATPDYVLLHECDIPVRWGDQDALGHVNNTVFFRFMEQVRVEWLDKQGFVCDPAQRQAPVIVQASCTFLQTINYPATVKVKLFAGDPGRSSVMTRYELLDARNGKLYATGGAKMVWVDLAAGKSAPLPEALVALLG
jgi:acyl-CoA thioester hydrolase